MFTKWSQVAWHKSQKLHLCGIPVFEAVILADKQKVRIFEMPPILQDKCFIYPKFQAVTHV